MKIAITGGIASGKSSVCRFFRELKAFVVSTDEIVHSLLKPNTDLGKDVIHLLNINSPEDERSFRKTIAAKVFKDPDLLNRLEQIIHPAVFKKIENLYDEASKKEIYTCFVVEIPLVFEIGKTDFFDTIITVLCSEEAARKRFEESGFAKNEYENRMKRQMAPREKAQQSDYVIYNNGSLEELKKQVILINQTLQNP